MEASGWRHTGPCVTNRRIAAGGIDRQAVLAEAGGGVVVDGAVLIAADLTDGVHELGALGGRRG